MKKYHIWGSKILQEDLKKYVPGGVSGFFHKPQYRDYPLAMDYGKGSKLYDVDGNEYIDYIGNSGSMILGYGSEVVTEAVEGQLKYGSLFSAPNLLMLELCRLLTEVIPSAEMVSFHNSGTEAVVQALGLARVYTGKNKIIKFEGEYHAWADEKEITITASSVEKFGAKEQPNNIHHTRKMKSDSGQWLLSAPWNDLDYLENLMKDHQDEIAAVIIEPIMCDSGPILPRKGFLSGLQKLTRKYGILLIFDEVITGFRAALGGAQEYYHVTPDLSIFAKAITAGFPFGVIAGKKEIMDQGGLSSSTFNGNPVGIAAALATIKELQKPGVYKYLETIGTALADGFQKLGRKYKIPVYTRVVGGIFILYFGFENDVSDYKEWLEKADTALYEDFVKGCEKYGVRFTDQRGREYISTAHTMEDVKRTLRVADIVLEKITDKSRNT